MAAYQSWHADYGAGDAEALLAAQADVALGTPGAWVQVAIAARDGGVLLGDCAVHVLQAPARTAEIGVTLAPASQGRGIGHEALRALIGTLFAGHGIHRVVAEVDDRNAAMQRLCERLGMRQEARFVEADRFKGEWATLRVYAVLAREWPSD